MLRLALFLAMLAPVGALAAAPPSPVSCGPAPELEKLHREIAAAKLDKVLDLSRDQARALLPVVREAALLREELQADRQRHLPALVQALTAVRDDIRRSGVVSDASRKALREALGAGTRQKVREKIDALRAKARDALTAEQQEHLKQFDPRPIEELEDEQLQGRPPGPHGPHGSKGGVEREAGHGPHRGRRAALMVAASPEFVALVEARAR